MTRSESESTRELYGFVDVNLARRLGMAKQRRAEPVSAFNRYWPDATWGVIGRYGDLWRADLSGEAHHWMGLYGPVTARDLERVQEFYRSRGVAGEIVVSPLADPSLRDLFAPRGDRITEFNSVLIRPLESCVLLPPAKRNNDRARDGRRPSKPGIA